MKAGESDPVWSPDSRRIAFSAKRDADEAVADLHPRSRRRRRGAARHEPLHRRALAEVQPRRQAPALRQHGLPERGRRRGEQGRGEGREGPQVQGPRRTTPSPSARGTAGSTKRSRTSSCSPSTAASAKDLLAGHEARGRGGIRGDGRRRGAARRSAASGRRTGSGSSSPRRRDATPARSRKSSTTSIASAPNGGEPEKHRVRARLATAIRRSAPTARRSTRRSSRTTARSTTSTQLVAFDWPSMKNERTVAQTDRSVGDYADLQRRQDDLLHGRGFGAGEDLLACRRAAARRSSRIDPERGAYSGHRRRGERAGDRRRVGLVGRSRTKWCASISATKKHTQPHRRSTSSRRATIDWAPPRALLVHVEARPEDPQPDRHAGGLRSVEEVPAVRADPRRRAQHVAATRSRCAGTITCSRSRAT